jgi:hypothetical protein
VCYQRLQSVAYLRDMLKPPHAVRCFRLGLWRVVSSQALLPGDIVSLTAAAPQGSAADHMVSNRPLPPPRLTPNLAPLSAPAVEADAASTHLHSLSLI